LANGYGGGSTLGTADLRGAGLQVAFESGKAVDGTGNRGGIGGLGRDGSCEYDDGG
jgi:hypothetical protein